MSDHHTHEGHLAACTVAVVVSTMALFLSIGPCALQEHLDEKVDHLEHRIDNIQFGGPR